MQLYTDMRIFVSICISVYQCTVFVNNYNFSHENIFYVITTVFYCIFINYQ